MGDNGTPDWNELAQRDLSGGGSSSPSFEELDARNRAGNTGPSGGGSVGYIADTIEAINLQIQNEQPGTAEALAGEWQTLSETLAGIADDLRTADEALTDWQSPAAREAYQSKFETLVQHLDDMAASAASMSSGLSALAAAMRDGQEKMRELYDDYQNTMSLWDRVQANDPSVGYDFVWQVEENSRVGRSAGPLNHRQHFVNRWHAEAREVAEEIANSYSPAITKLSSVEFPEIEIIDAVIHPRAYGMDLPPLPGLGGGPGAPPSLNGAPPPLVGRPPAWSAASGPGAPPSPGTAAPIGVPAAPPPSLSTGQPSRLPGAPANPPAPASPQPRLPNRRGFGRTAPVVTPPGLSSPGQAVPPRLHPPGSQIIAPARGGGPGHLPPASRVQNLSPGDDAAPSRMPPGASAPPGTGTPPRTSAPPGTGTPPGATKAPGTSAPPGTGTPSNPRRASSTPPGAPVAGSPSDPRSRDRTQEVAAPSANTPFTPPPAMVPPVLGDGTGRPPRPGSIAEAPGPTGAAAPGTPPVLSNPRRTSPSPTFTERRAATLRQRQAQQQKLLARSGPELTRDLPELPPTVLTGRSTAEPAPQRITEVPAALAAASQAAAHLAAAARRFPRPAAMADRATRRRPASAASTPAPAATPRDDRTVFEVESPGGPVLTGEETRPSREQTPRPAAGERVLRPDTSK